MGERGGIITWLVATVRRCAATAPNLSMTAVGIVFLMIPFLLFLLSCGIWGARSALPALNAVFDSDIVSALTQPIVVGVANLGPVVGSALILFSAVRAYRNYRRREPAFCKRGKCDPSNEESQ